jgi:hypothetical protein
LSLISEETHESLGERTDVRMGQSFDKVSWNAASQRRRERDPNKERNHILKEKLLN